MKSVQKNFLYNLAYQILAIILPLITAPYLARTLGAENIGIYSYTFSIANYFVLFGLLGINNYGVRLIAKHQNNRIEISRNFWSLYFFHLIVSIFSLFCYILYVILFDNTYFIISLCQVIFILSSVIDISWFFFGLEKFKVTVIRNTIIRLLTLWMILLFVKSSNDLLIYTLIMAFSTFFSQLVLWTFIKKEIDFYKPTVKEIFSHFYPNLMLFIPVIAVSFYNIMDKIILGQMDSMFSVGLYENSEKIINIPNGVIIAFGNVMLPRMSFMVENKQFEKIRNTVSKSIEFNMFVGSALAFGVAGIAPVFAPFFLGEEFRITGEVIPLLSIIIIIKAWANVIRNLLLLPFNRDKELTISLIVGAIINVIINIMLIPELGIFGAVYGTIFAELFVCLTQVYYVRSQIKFSEIISKSYIYLISGGVMFFIVRGIPTFINGNLLKLFAQILIGALSYLFIVFILYPNKKDLFEYLNFLPFFRHK